MNKMNDQKGSPLSHELKIDHLIIHHGCGSPFKPAMDEHIYQNHKKGD
jgi:hypothetical protein